jgi:nucleotide-binding universal stress UspA family protein
MNGQACPMAKMERLLVATDGSTFSENAVKEAILLAKRCSSKLFAVSVVITNLEFEVTMPQLVEKEEKKAREHLEAIKARAAKEGIDCGIMVIHGDEPYQDIIRQALENRVDMIIVGKHGRTGLVRLMMGSVAAKVIGHAPCNVLVVSPTARIEFKNILVATDGSRYGEAAIREAIGIAKKCNSSLVAVSVASSDAERKAAEGIVKNAVEVATSEGVKIDGLTIIGKPYEAIVETAKQKHADLIVVGSHGRRGFERLLMGSVTERVIGHTEAGVLVVKAR